MFEICATKSLNKYWRVSSAALHSTATLWIAVAGARPTNDISIEFEIQWNFVMLLFIIYAADYNNEILHTSRQ